MKLQSPGFTWPLFESFAGLSSSTQLWSTEVHQCSRYSDHLTPCSLPEWLTLLQWLKIPSSYYREQDLYPQPRFLLWALDPFVQVNIPTWLSQGHLKFDLVEREHVIARPILAPHLVFGITLSAQTIYFTVQANTWVFLKISPSHIYNKFINISCWFEFWNISRIHLIAPSPLIPHLLRNTTFTTEVDFFSNSFMEM